MGWKMACMKRNLRQLKPMEESQLERLGYRLESGLGLETGLNGLGGLRPLKEQLQTGARLAQAFALAGWKMSEEERGILEVAEGKGQPGAGLLKVLENRKAQRERQREGFSQLIYPLILFLIGGGVLVILTLWVIPEMQRLYAGIGQGGELPFWTQNVGRFYAAGVILALGIMAGGFGIERAGNYLARRSYPISEAIWKLRTAIPVFGSIWIVNGDGKRAGRLAAWLESGLSLPQAVERLRKGCPNLRERAAWEQLEKQLGDGLPLSSASRNAGIFSADSADLLESAEEQGRLAFQLNALAQEVAQRQHRRSQQIGQLIEPALLLLMSGLVGGILIAFLLPLFRLYNEIGG